MKKCMVLLFLVPFLLTGCWDKVEIEERDYAITMGVDYGENGYTLTLCMGALGDEDTSIASNLTGVRLTDAMEALNLRSSNPVYYGMLKALVIGKGAEEKLPEILDTLAQHDEMNGRLLLVASSQSAAEVVEAVPDTNTPYGLYFTEYFKNQEVTSVNLTDARLALAEGQEVTLPKCRVTDGGIAME